MLNSQLDSLGGGTVERKKLRDGLPGGSGWETAHRAADLGNKDAIVALSRLK